MKRYALTKTISGGGSGDCGRDTKIRKLDKGDGLRFMGLVHHTDATRKKACQELSDPI